MIKNLKLKIRNLQKGITLVEIVVIVFIIILFTAILVSDFPRMLRQLALSRATYNFAQNLRKAQDFGLSGVKLFDGSGTTEIAVKGYGIYINISNNNKRYVIYADVANAAGNSDIKYSGDTTYPLCSSVNQLSNGTLNTDCVIEVIDLSKENPSIFIDSITNVSGFSLTSINFSPPGPKTNIDNLTVAVPAKTQIEIIFKNTDGIQRTVSINTSGLISIE